MLRPLQQEDSHLLYPLFQNDDAKLFLDLPIYSFDRFDKQINEWLALEIMGLCIPRTIWTGDKIAGIILLTNISQREATSEMGTWIGSPFRGQGLNFPAKFELLRYAFKELSMENILLVSTSSNIRSIKSIEKLPFANKKNDKYAALKKEREFLFRQPFEVFEITRGDFLCFSLEE